MGKVLIVTDKDQDYAADYLASGFVAAGHEVIDFPRKPSLHIGDAEPRFDCDLDLPEHALSAVDVAQCLAAREFDLIVVPTLRGLVRGQLLAWNRVGLLERNRDIIVAYDGEDHPHNTRPVFTACLGEDPAAYFKRELPLGENWAIPLPFGYPAERVVSSKSPNGGVAYTAHVWDWCGPDSMRVQLRQLLGRLALDCGGYWIPTERLSVAEDHRFHRLSLIAVSPAGQGSLSNRHLQCIADGCCPVIEQPSVQWPNAPQDHIECRYFKSATECVDIVDDLLNEPERARDMARAAQVNLLKFHSTRHRAETVWGKVHHDRGA